MSAASSFAISGTGVSVVGNIISVDTTRVPYFGSAITGTPSNTTFLRGDGVWAVPGGGGGSPAGSDGYIQFNTGGAFNADAQLFWDNTTKYFAVGSSTTQIYTDTFLQLVKNDNAYRSIGVQNLSAGALAAGDFTAYRNDTTGTTNFASFGINSSAYNDPTYPIQGAGSAYAFVNGGNMVIGTQTAHDVIFHTGGTALTDRALVIKGGASDKGYVGFLEGTSINPTLLGKVHIINESDAQGTFFADRYSAASSPLLTLRRSRGTFALPTAVQTDDGLGGFGFRGYGSTGFSSGSRVLLIARAAENWTDAAQGAYFSFQTTLIGSTTMSEKLRIWDNGRLDVFNEFATRAGSDNASTGTINDVSTSATSFIRFTNATGPTITGFANGVNGKHLTITNTGAGTVTVANNNAGSVAANRIITGTGANVTIPTGSSVTMIYDATSSLWRVVGSPAFSGTALTGSLTASRLTYASGTSTVAVGASWFADGTNMHIGATTTPANNGRFATTNSTTSASATVRSEQTFLTVNPASASATGNYIGKYVQTDYASANSLAASGVVYGLYNVVNFTLAGAIGATVVAATRSEMNRTGATTVTKASVNLAIYNNNNATGGTTTLALYEGQITNPAGTITTAYGFYIASGNMSSATNRWGVYIEDANANNYFARQLLVGTTTPNANTDINIISNGAIKYGNSAASATSNGGTVKWDGKQNWISDATNWNVVGFKYFSATANGSVSNTITATDFVSTGVGTKTIPANLLAVGTKIMVRAKGSVANTASPNITLEIRLGSTQLLTTFPTNMGTLTGTREWQINAEFTVRSIGATGTIMGQGQFTFWTTGYTVNSSWAMVPNAGVGNTVTIDTTTAQVLTGFVTWGTASPSNTFTCNQFDIQVI